MYRFSAAWLIPVVFTAIAFGSNVKSANAFGTSGGGLIPGGGLPPEGEVTLPPIDEPGGGLPPIGGFPPKGGLPPIGGFPPKGGLPPIGGLPYGGGLPPGDGTVTGSSSGGGSVVSSPRQVPEPNATTTLLGMGIIGAGLLTKRRYKATLSR